MVHVVILLASTSYFLCFNVLLKEPYFSKPCFAFLLLLLCYFVVVVFVVGGGGAVVLGVIIVC